MTPVCPKCGTVDIRIYGSQTNPQAMCLEEDCRHMGSKSSFRQKYGPNKTSNTKWRDPIALGMDGYEGE